MSRSQVLWCVSVIGMASLALTLALGDPPPSKGNAQRLADEWWYVGDGKSRDNESTQKTGAGNEESTFFAYTGSVINRGSYGDAWNFYAKKCGTQETFSEQRQILGKPSATKGYYTIFQRIDKERQATTFASHEKDATVTVHLQDLEASPEKTVLQISVVVARH
jgi:hypothetical protein